MCYMPRMSGIMFFIMLISERTKPGNACRLSGEAKLPKTLMEALAAIKIIGSAWPARNYPTPVSLACMHVRFCFCGFLKVSC